MRKLSVALAVILAASAWCAAAEPQEDPRANVPLEGRHAGEVVKLFRRAATVKVMDVTPCEKIQFTDLFKFDCYGDEALAQLRSQEKLDDVIAKGKTEFARQVLLMDWAHRRIKLFGQPTKPEAKKPLDILKAVDEGHAFNCGYYARLLREALRSVGYVARSVGLKGSKSDGNGTEHAIVEVWSNQAGKWFVLDPTLNVYFVKGVPLNAWEIRKEWFYNGGNDPRMRIVVGTDAKTYTKADLPIERGTHKGFGTLKLSAESLGKFLYLAYMPTKPDGSLDYAAMFITKDKLCEGVPYHTRKNPADPALEPYWPMQQAAVHFERRGGINLEFFLKTLTPDFETFRYRIDGKAWTDCGEGTNEAPNAWRLHEGTNSLEVVAVNKFGIEGRPSRIVLERD